MHKFKVTFILHGIVLSEIVNAESYDGAKVVLILIQPKASILNVVMVTTKSPN